jgi:predicted nucleotidyltransferase
MAQKSTVLEATLRVLRQREPELRARGILHAAIFGSVARGQERDDSDVDVVVEVQRGFGFGTVGLMDLEEELRAALGRSVDVISLGGVRSPKHDGILRDMVRAF